jgi:hypothetical protein
VFHELRLGIDNDISTINATKQPSEDNRFSVEPLQSGMGVVIGQPRRVPNRRVLVAVSDHDIEVHDEVKGVKWSATVGLNYEGRCILRLGDGTELEQWQFRKKALEGMLFGD